LRQPVVPRQHQPRLREKAQSRPPGTQATPGTAVTLGTSVAPVTPATSVTPATPVTPVTPARPAPAKVPAKTLQRAARVAADPLAPRYTNSQSPPTASRRAALASARPATLQHEIAGLAREPYPDSTVAAPTTSRTPAPLPDLRLVAADALDRIEAREPVYPAQALRDRTSGFVELEFTITETGAVRDIDVLTAQPGGVFERAAVEALAGWRFRPRYVYGQPVLQRSSITMRFDVDD
jgi:periplasmic protein TonB